MDPITSSVVVVLGKYALDKGAELAKQVGPKALETAAEMFKTVLERVKRTDPRTAERFPENPDGYSTPLADALDETLKTDPNLAAQLKTLLAQYEQAAKAHAAAAGTVYRAELEGSGAIAQGDGAVAAGGVAVGGDIHGDVVTGSRSTVFDQRGQTVGTQINVAGDYVEPGPGGAPPPTQPAGDWNTKALRQLLLASFNDEELTTLCFDHFNPVYQQFAGGMSRGDKVQHLLDFGLRQGQVERMLEVVQARNPAQYARFAGQLKT